MRRLIWILGLIFGWSAPAVGGEFFTLEGHGGPIKGIAVSPDGESILTASFDNSVGLWRDRSPQWLEGHAAAVNVVAFVSEDIAVSAGDDFGVFVWDLETGRSQKLGEHHGKVMSLASTKRGAWVASASWDGTIRLWSLAGQASKTINVGSNVNDIAFSAEGNLLYSASSDGKIQIWDVANGQLNRLFLRNGFGVNTLVLDTQRGWLAFGAVDGVARIVDAQTAELIKDVTLERRPILAMAVSRDAQTLAIGDGEGYIMLLDATDWTIKADFRATHRGPIWALAFSPDGENIHAGGLDDEMFSWPLADAKSSPKMVEEQRGFLNGADSASNGERQFQRKCSICHSLTADSQRRAGPTLNRVMGRPAGTVEDYVYSETLTGSDIIWNAQTIDALFEMGPDVYIRGTKMPVQRIARPEDRADLIDYLRLFGETEENQ